MIQGEAPLTVDFTDASSPTTAIATRLWDFGDGSTSTDQNPSHTYSTYGLYTVTLTISNGISTSTYTDSVLVVPDDQSSYWPLDEDGGTRAESLGGLDLTDNNNTLSSEGVLDSSATFDSALSQYLSRAANGTELYPQGNFTCSFWMYPTGIVPFEKYGVIAKNRLSGVDSPFYAYWYYSRFAFYELTEVRFVGTDGSVAFATCPVGLVPVNQWTHIAFGYNTVTKMPGLWVSGVNLWSYAIGPLTADPAITGTCPLHIGAGNNIGAPNDFYDGRIDDLRFFDRLLSDAEVAVLATRIPNPNQTSYERSAQVMLDISNDGGKTWIAQPWRSAGKQGEYLKRVRWNRLGAARRRVLQVSVTDPVAWKVVGAYLPGQGNGNG